MKQNARYGTMETTGKDVLNVAKEAEHYADKENVIIYDYVDNHIPMFNNIYMKMLKVYKQIGYETVGELMEITFGNNS